MTFIPAGKFTTTHGIKGELKAEIYLDSAAFLKSFKRIYIESKEYNLISVKSLKNYAIVGLEGIEDINSAMEFKGLEFSVNRDDAKLKKGKFFLADLIGFEVIDKDGYGLGSVNEFFENPAHPIMVVKGENEHMIPAIPEFIKEIDADNRLITVELLEGM